MIAWMGYAAVVGGVVAVAGLALERLAEAAGRPRRIAWMAALALAVAIPLTGGWRGAGAMPGAEDGAWPAAEGLGVVEVRRGAIPALPVPEGGGFDGIAALAWVSGSLGSFAVVACVLVVVARGRRRWERRRVDGTDVRVSRRFGPAVVGVARPEVVVPAWVLRREPGARRAIVRHEAEHLRAHDPASSPRCSRGARRSGGCTGGFAPRWNWTATNGSWRRGSGSPTTATSSWTPGPAPPCAGESPRRWVNQGVCSNGG